MRKLLLPLITLLSTPFLSVSQRNCGSQEVLKQQMAANPEFAKKVKNSERSLSSYAAQLRAKTKPAGQTGIIIPVVVHVVYNIPEENISNEQVQSQIDVLNEDYAATNSDYKNYDAGYGGVKGDAEISFCLVQTVRVQTRVKSFAINDNMKYDRRGGSDAIDPAHYLNIWVCDLSQGYLGYAQFPGGPLQSDGIVIDYQATGRGNFPVLYPDFNLGRTATHEIGHWLGLRHIWGDATCGNDFVNDTPLHNAPNYGCPEQGHRSTCTGTPLEMWMNYMDYTDDRCMYFFSDGQVARMNYFMENDPNRLYLINNASCNTTLITAAPAMKKANESATGKPGFAVFPTIATSAVTLSATSDYMAVAELVIKNLEGKEILRRKMSLQSGLNKTIISVSGLKNGVYLLQLVREKEVQTQKIIVQR